MNILSVSIIVGSLVTILGGYTIFIFLLSSKIQKLERKIEALFVSRTNLIPCIYEISRDYLVKHDEIFKEIIILRKNEFSAKENTIGFPGFIQAETSLHHELNFVFKVCNQHKKLLKDGNFLYVRDLLIERSMAISKKMTLYKNIVKKFNWHLKIHRFFIVGFFLAPYEIIEV